MTLIALSGQRSVACCSNLIILRQNAVLRVSTNPPTLISQILSHALAGGCFCLARLQEPPLRPAPLPERPCQLGDPSVKIEHGNAILILSKQKLGVQSGKLDSGLALIYILCIPCTASSNKRLKTPWRSLTERLK